MLVSGRLDQHSWEDKETHQKRSRVEIVVEDLNFLGGGSREGSNNYSAATPSDAGNSNDGDNTVPDEIPEEEVDLTEVPF